MRIRCNATVISAVLLSLCLATFIPGSVKFAATWKEAYFRAPGYAQQNLLMPLGFCSLGIVMIGLIVLWTGFRKSERWAWLVMLIILLSFVFPLTVLKLLLDMQTPEFEWSYWIQGIREGYGPSIWVAEGVLTFVVMTIALLLPIKAFFWRQSAAHINSGIRGPEA